MANSQSHNCERGSVWGRYSSDNNAINACMESDTAVQQRMISLKYLKTWLSLEYSNASQTWRKILPWRKNPWVCPGNGFDRKPVRLLSDIEKKGKTMSWCRGNIDRFREILDLEHLFLTCCLSFHFSRGNVKHNIGECLEKIKNISYHISAHVTLFFIYNVLLLTVLIFFFGKYRVKSRNRTTLSLSNESSVICKAMKC